MKSHWNEACVVSLGFGSDGKCSSEVSCMIPWEIVVKDIRTVTKQDVEVPECVSYDP
jgi:hypothetical protein